MALRMAVYTKRHMIHPNDNRRTLCGGMPATLGADPTNYPRKVTCVRCCGAIARLAQSLNEFGKALYILPDRYCCPENKDIRPGYRNGAHSTDYFDGAACHWCGAREGA